MRRPLPTTFAALLTGALLLGGCIIPTEDSGTADFNVSPQPATVGEPVSFFPVGFSFDLDYSFDLDGDGAFDDGGVSKGGLPSGPEWTYTTPGPRTVSMDIRQDAAFFISFPPLPVYVHTYATKQIDVQPAPAQPQANRPPVARFTTNANPGYAEYPVSFNASESSDPEGPIALYQWDFENDGTFDQQSDSPTTTYTYNQAGTYDARLRVTDAAGLTNDTTRAVPVVNGEPPQQASGQLRAARMRGGKSFTFTLTASILDQGETFIQNDTLSQVGILARGRMTLRGLPAPFETRRTARWAADLTFKQRGNDKAARTATEGYLLVDVGRGDRLCLSGRVAGSLDDSDAGRLKLVGGSGKAKHLRGAAEFPVTQASRHRGRMKLARTRRATPLPKACRTLVRVLRAR